jgi:hypothetical protein
MIALFALIAAFVGTRIIVKFCNTYCIAHKKKKLVSVDGLHSWCPVCAERENRSILIKAKRKENEFQAATTEAETGVHLGGAEE